MRFRAARVLSLSLLTVVGLLASSAHAEDLEVGDLLRPDAASWFRVTGPDGAIIGFGRLEYGPEEYEYVVKMRIGIEMRGQRHEESQEMRLEKRTLRMLSHVLTSGESEIRGTRVDDGFRVDAGDERATISLEEDASCLSLVFAAMMPGREGTTFARSVADPRKGYAVSGKFHLETRSKETFKTESGAVETRRYELKSPHGRAYSIWVDAAHAVVRVDLPGGIRLLKSAKSTEHLFVRKAPALVEVEGAKDRLTMVGRADRRRHGHGDLARQPDAHAVVRFRGRAHRRAHGRDREPGGDLDLGPVARPLAPGLADARRQPLQRPAVRAAPPELRGAPEARGRRERVIAPRRTLGAMKTLLITWLGVVLALAACRTTSVEPADDAVGGARPEVRYYVIADT